MFWWSYVKLKCAKVEQRRAMMRGIRDSPKAGDVRLLIAALADKDYEVRSEAAEGLASIADPRVVEPLIRALPDTAMNTTYMICRALGRLRDPRALPALVELSRDPDEHRSDAAMWGLYEMGDPLAVDLLIAKLKPSNIYGNTDVVEALGELRDPRAVGPLTAHLNYWAKIDLESEGTGRCSYGSRQAIRALGRIGDPRAVEPLTAALKAYSGFSNTITAALTAIGPAAVVSLIRSMEHEDGMVRWDSANALLSLNWEPATTRERILLAIAHQRFDDAIAEGDDAIDRLIAILKSRTDVRLWSGVAEALANAEEPRAVEPLIAILNSVATDSIHYLGRLGIAKPVARALGEIGGPRAIKALVSVLGREYTDEAAAETLVGMGLEAVEPLTEVLAHQSSSVRFSAAQVLITLRWVPTTGRDRAFLAVAAKHFVDAVAEGSDAVEPLIAALKDWDQRVRIDAVDALGQIGNVLAVDPLIALMNNSHGEDGLRATKALGQIGGERAIDALIARIEFLSGCFSNDGLDKTADSLTQCGTAAVDPLIQLLRHRIGYVRERAAISLGKIGDRRAVEPLIAALKDEEDGHVSYLAAEALGSIGDARAVPVLVALLQGQPYEVRHALKPVASLLTRNSDHFSRDQLIQLSQLQDISFTYELHATIEEVMGYGWEPTLTKHYFLDCSIVRNLAERILRTRSAKKESG